MSRFRSSDPGWSVALLACLLSLVFLALGLIAFEGTAPWMRMLDRNGLPGGFRVETGAVQIAGALGLLIRPARFYAAIVLAATMIVAAMTRMLEGGNAVPAIVLLMLTAIVALCCRPPMADTFA